MTAKTNGEKIHRISRKGKALFALGDGAPFEIDVIATHSDWVQLDRSFRDENGLILPDKAHDIEAAAWEFARAVSGTPDITLAEALEFLAVLAGLADDLSAFFERRSSKPPSSPESTAGPISLVLETG